MEGVFKMAFPLILVNFFVFVIAHKENLAPGEDEAATSSEESLADVKNDFSPPRRNGQQWQYEGMPIELPSYRRSSNKLPIIEGIPTTTIPTTIKFDPPLDPRYRRIYDPDERATVEDYQFMAAVMMNKQLWCGAAVIDTDTVITAAHCLQLQYNNRFFREYVKMLTVRVGSNNATAGGEVFKVTEITFHPNYKPSSLEFNVAILRLHKNISFGGDPPVSPIEPAREKLLPVDTVITFLGWGSVLGGGGLGGVVLLQKIDLPVYDFADCQNIYGRDLVTHSNFCAGYITKRKNVCNHDAGGPAIMNNKLIGILSFSAKRCDNLDRPAVFTSVGYIKPWLDELQEAKIKNSLKVA